MELAEALSGPTDARGVAQRTLESLLAAVNGRNAGLFSRQQERMVLFASRGMDQHALDVVQKAWNEHKAELLEGRALVESPLSDGTSFAIVPVTESASLAGLLYVQCDEPRFREARDMESLAQFCQVAGLVFALRQVEGYLERTPREDIHRQQLLVLLQRDGWNVTRVARKLGITRATVYNRAKKLGITIAGFRKRQLA